MKHACISVIEANPLLRDGMQRILREGCFSVKQGASLSEVGSDADGMETHLVLWGPGVDPVTIRSELAAIRARNADGASTRCVALADPSRAATMRRLTALDLDAILPQDISGHILQRSLELVLLGQQLFPPSRPKAWSKVPAVHRGGVVPFVPRGHPGPPQPGVSQPRTPGPAQDAAPPRPRRHIALSNREGRTLACLVNGMTNKSIARELGISEETVKVHVKSLLRKLGVANRTLAAMWAVKNADSIPRPAGPVQLGPMPLGPVQLGPVQVGQGS